MFRQTTFHKPADQPANTAGIVQGLRLNHFVNAYQEQKVSISSQSHQYTLTLTKELLQIKFEEDQYLSSQQNETVGITDLITRYRKLLELGRNHTISIEMRILIEGYKLAIINTFQNHLGQKYLHDDEEEENKRRFEGKPSWQERASKMLYKVFYGFLFSVGVLQDGFGSYLYGYSLLAVIPNIAAPLLIGAALGFALINTFLLFLFKINSVRNDFGIYSNGNKSMILVDNQENQLNGAKKINRVLFDVNISNQIPGTVYQSYAPMGALINEDLAEKRKTSQEFKESISKTIFRWAMTAFGTIMVVSGGYFIGKSILGLVAASLLATPISWLIIGISIASSLFFYFIQASSMLGVINPDYEKYTAVKKELKNFHIKEEHHFEEVIQNKLEKEVKDNNNKEVKLFELAPPQERNVDIPSLRNERNPDRYSSTFSFLNFSHEKKPLLVADPRPLENDPYSPLPTPMS